MHPILFVVESGAGQRPIASFGVMLALGMLLGAVVSVRGAHRAGIDWSDALAIVAVVAASGLFGAYALQVVVETARGAQLRDAAARGGLVFYGAPLAGTLALLVAARAMHVPVGSFCDAVVPGVPIAHAMGRIGCFLAGCCYGRPSDLPWAVSFTDPMAAASIDPVHRHPVQLYESGMLLLLALAFALVPPSQVGTGRRAVAYAGSYAVLRIVVERFRGDAERGFVTAFLSTSDAISLAVLALVAAYFARTSRGRGKDVSP